MKRILSLITLGLVLCLTASAFRGVGGEGTRKGSRKKSGTTSGTRRRTLSAEMKKQLAVEMVRNAFNPGWFQKCMDEAGGIDRIVDIAPISLSTPDVHQYLLSGKVVENGESCAFGARTPMYWVYEVGDNGIRILADIGAADTVKVSSRRTNGYRDIQIGGVFNAGRSFSTTYMKYNGRAYK